MRVAKHMFILRLDTPVKNHWFNKIILNVLNLPCPTEILSSFYDSNGTFY